MRVRIVEKYLFLGKIHIIDKYMGVENRPVRKLIDVTGVLIVPKNEEVKLPMLRQPVSKAFFDYATDVAYALRTETFEDYAYAIYGRGNFFKRAILDQEFNWRVLKAGDISHLLDEKEGWGERIMRESGSYLRDPKWLPRPGTKIDLEDFAVNSAQIDRLKKQKAKKTIVSGNSFWQRRSIVKMIGTEMTSQLDPDMGIILPPHYEVGSGKLKIGAAIWSKEAQGEEVEGNDDDYAIALLWTAAGARVTMSIDEKSARNQSHVTEVIKASGVANLIKESNVTFAEI